MIYNLSIDKAVFNNLRLLNHERVYCFNGNKLIFKKDSGMNPDKIDFTLSERKEIRFNVNCIVHNHCNNSSLSLQDFMLAVLNDVQTMIAISPNYIWRLDFVLPFKDAIFILSDVRETYDNFKLRIGKPLFQHIVWSVISGHYDCINYSVIPLEI